MNENILQIILAYTEAISFVKEEIKILEEKKPWKLKELIAQNSSMIIKFNSAREVISNKPSILNNCNSEEKSKIINLCNVLESCLKRKMELLEEAMFINDMLVAHIKKAIHRTNTGYHKEPKKCSSFIPVSIDEKI